MSNEAVGGESRTEAPGCPPSRGMQAGQCLATPAYGPEVPSPGMGTPRGLAHSEKATATPGPTPPEQTGGPRPSWGIVARHPEPLLEGGRHLHSLLGWLFPNFPCSLHAGSAATPGTLLPVCAFHTLLHRTSVWLTKDMLAQHLPNHQCGCQCNTPQTGTLFTDTVTTAQLRGSRERDQSLRVRAGLWRGLEPPASTL